jgi:hypothetical protein
MKQFFDWCKQYYVEITWFLIGWLVLSAMINIGNENYLVAFTNIVLAGANYLLYRNKL